MSSLLTIFAAVCALASLLAFIAGLVALRNGRLFGTLVSVTGALLLLTLGALSATIGVATQGYRTLTREEVAATVRTTAMGPQRFRADFTFPDGSESTFDLSGDEFYVDAHILKWKPLANLFGLHTAYELDRVAGRYLELEDERTKVRTLFALSEDKPVDMFTLRRRYSWFGPLLDAEYGSATFVPAERNGAFEVRVSTTGLLVRRVP